MRSMWGILKMAVVAGSVVVCVGCGPIEYVNQVTRRASSEVEAAKAVNWGYEEVYTLRRGTRVWAEAGYPIETAE